MPYPQEIMPPRPEQVEEERHPDLPVHQETDSAPRGTVVDFMRDRLRLGDIVIKEVEDMYKDCFACGRWINSGLSCRFGLMIEFYVHKSCAELPREMEHGHPTPVPVTIPVGSDSEQENYCLLPLKLMMDNDAKAVCTICRKFRMRSCIYACQVCSWGIHLSCILEGSTGRRIEPQIEVFSLGLTALSFLTRDEHPLAVIAVDERKRQCRLCNAIDRSHPFVGREECGVIFYHQKCTEAPLEIEHPSDSEGHRLRLTYQDVFSYCPVCKVCGERVRKSDYVYICDSCCYGIHLSCVVQERSSLTHSGHHHPLTKLSKPHTTRCDACGCKHSRDERSVFYACRVCNCYWIGETCVEMPSTVSFGPHEHRLVLLFSLPRNELFKGLLSLSCRICNAEVDPTCWCYWCAECSYIVHVRCNEESDLLPVRISRGEFLDKSKLIHLPLKTTFVADIFQEVLVIDDEDEDEDEGGKRMKTKLHWSHELPLDFIETTKDDDDIQAEQGFCNACTQLISVPFFSCAGCNFFLHRSCSFLPKQLRNSYHNDDPQHKLSLKAPRHFTDFRDCTFCHRYTNGFFYQCEICPNFILDVVCAMPKLLPEFVLHLSHDHHAIGKLDQIYITGQCNFCSDPGSYIVFECRQCSDFRICLTCATLPRAIPHKQDDHPLSPVPYSGSEDRGEDYCGFCEKLIPNWYKMLVRCVPCDQTFHDYCIPELGYYSKMKFGGTLQAGGDDAHDHPLRFLSKSRVRSRVLCDKCFSDVRRKPLFECEQLCGFRRCFDCWIRDKIANATSDMDSRREGFNILINVKVRRLSYDDED